MPLWEPGSRAPGVVTAGLNDYVPFQAEDGFAGIRLDDRPPPKGPGLREEWRRVSQHYFAAAGIRTTAGRGFEASDYDDGPLVAIVNEAFARKHYRGDAALGKPLTIWNSQLGAAEIVGVVSDVRRRGLAVASPPVLYAPFHHSPRANMALFVRTQGRPETMIAPVKEAIWSIDSSQPIDAVAPLSDVLQASIGVPRMLMALFAALASTALLLAALGVFGTFGYAVRLRRRELGVRLALGAEPRRLRTELLERAALFAALGIAIGLAIAVVAGTATASLLHGVSSSSPAPLALAAATLFASALGATWLPSRRIGAIDPSEALRNE